MYFSRLTTHDSRFMTHAIHDNYANFQAEVRSTNPLRILILLKSNFTVR